MERVDTQGHIRERERNGNVWSGAVAMVLLGLFVIALVSSELDAGQRTGCRPANSDCRTGCSSADRWTVTAGCAGISDLRQ